MCKATIVKHSANGSRAAKMTQTELFGNLELARLNHATIQVADLEYINAPDKICQVYVHLRRSILQFINFFTHEVEDNEREITVIPALIVEIDNRYSRVRIELD